MRKNKFIDLELGTAIKRFGLYVAVFVIAFGLTSSIRNAGGTYAASTGCPSGYSISGNSEGYCCPNKYLYNYDGSDIDSALSGKCYRKVDATELQCDASLGEISLGPVTDENLLFCYTDNVKSSLTIPTLTLNANEGLFKSRSNSNNYTAILANETPEYDEDNESFKATISYDSWTLSRENYSFRGFVKESSDNCSTAVSFLQVGDTIGILKDTTLYACWSFSGYTITYNTDDWSIYDKGQDLSYKTISVSTNSSGAFTLLGTDNSASYYMLEDSGEFLGWTKTKGSCANPLNGSQTVSANTTYYACWGTTTDEGNQPGTDTEQPGGTTGDSDKDETETYDVTFDVGSGNEFYIKGKKSDDDTITDVSEINFSEYTAEHQDGLDFLGWSETSKCNEYHLSKQFKVEEDTTLYACYADPPVDEPDGYEVTFDVGTDGTFYVNQTKKNNNVLTLSKLVYSTYTAKKDGYVFKGWGTSKNCEKGESRGTLTVEDDTTLYACFVEETDIEENPATGDFLLYLAFLIGILALGYTGYYAYKTVKSRE